MAEGQGNITYGRPPGAAPPFVNVAGARNGTSIDSGDYVILGQPIGAAGDPAQLLSDEEIPAEGFYLDFFDGIFMVSNERTTPTGTAMLQVINNDLGSAIDPGSLLLVNQTAATNGQAQYSPSLVLQGTAFDGVGAVSVTGSWIIQGQPNNGDGGVNGSLIYYFESGSSGPIQAFQFLNDGLLLAEFGFTGDIFQVNSEIHFENGGSQQIVFGNNLGGMGYGALYLFPGGGGPDNTPTAYAAANLENGVDREFFILGWTTTADMVTFNVGAAGAGIVRPVAFVPPIRFGDTTPPTAVMDITPGTSILAPFGLNAGPLLGTPMAGKMEYDGTHLYFTTSTGIRQTVTLV